MLQRIIAWFAALFDIRTLQCMAEISTPQTAALAGVSEQTVRDWCNNGLVKHRRVGLRRSYRIEREDFIRLAKELGYIHEPQGQ